MAKQKPDPEPADHVAPGNAAPNDPEDDAAVIEAPPRATPMANRALTFGEKAVGLSFNPSGDPDVNEFKRLYAKIIDLCHAKRASLMQGSEAHRLYAVAITTAQDAQMWSVKAATWKD